MIRFRNIFSTPPSGIYEYELDGVLVQDRTRVGINAKVRELRASKGLATQGDGFAYVMDWMCPRMPNGFCGAPSSVPAVEVRVIKANTASLFGARLAPSDVAERRLEQCVQCPEHTRRGVCIDCTGLLEWVRKGMPGRGALPADNASGACLCDEVLAAAGASVATRPLLDDGGYPQGCWRLTEVPHDKD
ncbi:MAG: hypothetical protein FJ279_00440 [Planctomycetes bacterium]|nr:hypothetical protein [Planctomycetota bacterium]